MRISLRTFYLTMALIYGFFIFPAFASSGSKLQKSLVLILLGPPGAGKGSQAAMVQEQTDLPHISTGELLRENVKNNTALGKEAKAYMDRGELVPDKLILEMLFARIQEKDCQKGYILDGFPRTEKQAEALSSFLGNKEKVMVVNLDLSDEVIVERLSQRKLCSGCQAPYHMLFSPPKKDNMCDKCGKSLYQRDDDKKEVILNRLTVYHKQTSPLIAFYTKQKLLVNLDANRSKEAIVKDILQLFQENNS